MKRTNKFEERSIMTASQEILEVFGAVTFECEVVVLGPTDEAMRTSLNRSGHIDDYNSGDIVLLRCWGVHNNGDKTSGPVKHYNNGSDSPISSINIEIIGDNHRFAVGQECFEALFKAIRISQKKFIPRALKQRLGLSQLQRQAS